MTGSAGLALLVLALAGARPPAYGGEVVAYVYGDGANLDPVDARTAGDAAAQAAVYEPLYGIGEDGLLVPILAGDVPTIVDGVRVVVPLRKDVALHDGRELTPSAAAEALARLDGPYAGRYVLSAVRRVNGRPAIIADEAQSTVVFELRHPDPDFPHLLAADHARLAWPATSGPLLIGTGPFAWETDTVQGPFLRHRRGRPFIDRLIWRPYASRFGAGALAERGEAPVFGGPETPRSVSGPGTWLVLQVGARVGGDAARERVRGHVNTALGRDLIVRRYLGPQDRPATGFIDAPRSEPVVKAEALSQLELLAPRGLRFGHRLVERIQLDLFRSGLRAQIRWIEPSRLVRLDPAAFDLRLLEVRPGVADDGSIRAALHRTLSAGGAFGVSVDPERLARFAAADAARRRPVLADIEAWVRHASGAVVIGRVAPAVALPTAWASDLSHGFDWADLIVEAVP